MTLATLGVVASASMPWGSYTVALPAEGPGGVGEFTSNGWAGRLILGGLALPNGLVVFAAAIACWCCWLRALVIGRIPAALPLAFSIYGLVHAAAIGFVHLGPDSHPGPGIPAAIACFGANLALIGRGRDRPPAPTRAGRDPPPRTGGRRPRHACDRALIGASGHSIESCPINSTNSQFFSATQSRMNISPVVPLSL